MFLRCTLKSIDGKKVQHALVNLNHIISIYKIQEGTCLDTHEATIIISEPFEDVIETIANQDILCEVTST